MFFSADKITTIPINKIKDIILVILNHSMLKLKLSVAGYIFYRFKHGGHTGNNKIKIAQMASKQTIRINKDR